MPADAFTDYRCSICGDIGLWHEGERCQACYRRGHVELSKHYYSEDAPPRSPDDRTGEGD